MGQTRTLLTAEQIPLTAATRRAELVRGELIEMTPVFGRHGRVVMRVGSWLTPFVETRKLGWVATEWGFILSRNPDTVRAPDLSFVAASRLTPESDSRFFDGAPDLAVEVLSPSESASAVQEKVREYLDAGTRLVWVVDPQTQTVTSYHPSGDAHVYRANEQVSGEDVLPGFAFSCADLFRFE